MRAYPVAYSIKTEAGLKLDIAILETESLILHEETIPIILEKLIQSIKDDGILRDPVVVDRDSLVVLDGMHRVKALRTLGCRLTCACLVDYKSPEIKVEEWCRIIPNQVEAHRAFDLVEELGLKLTPRFSCHSLEDRGTGSVLIVGDSFYDVVASDRDLLSVFNYIREFELRLRAMGFEVDYETSGEVKEKLKKKLVGVILYPPKIEKKQVVDIAREGRVFTFKATRHIIPARPVGVDVPLSLLQEPYLSIKEANQQLSRMLINKRVKRIPPGGIWMGRRYDKNLYFFENRSIDKNSYTLS